MRIVDPKSIKEEPIEARKLDSEISEKEKLADMDRKQKWQYFKDYYLLKTIAVCVLAVFLISVLYTVLSPKVKTVMYAAISDLSYFPAAYAEIEEGFTSHLNLDPKKNNVQLDYSYYIKNDSMSLQKFATYLFSNEIDIFIGLESTFANYALSGTFVPLKDCLTPELYEQLSSLAASYPIRIDENETIETATGPVSEYGIYIDGLSIYEEYPKDRERIVLGVIVNSEHKENGVEFIKYLFDNYSAPLE